MGEKGPIWRLKLR